MNGGWYSFKSVKYLYKVYTPYAIGGALIYLSYYLIGDVLRGGPHGHSHGRPRIIDDMIAFGIIGGGLGLYTKGIKFVPHGIIVGTFLAAPILHYFK